jgi:hypothetical protein
MTDRQIDRERFKYGPHRFAKLFPAMTEGEFDDLVEDIKTHGLRESIALYDGEILDGCNRYRACERAGVEPTFAYPAFHGDKKQQDAQALHYVVSRNLKRRYLTVPQRTTLLRDLRQQPEWRDASNREIARQIGVSEATVRRAQIPPTTGGLSASRDADASQTIENTQPASQHTVSAKRGEQDYRMRIARKSEAEDATRPKPAPAAFAPADVMMQMRMDAQRLSGASLAQLIAEWIIARVEVSVAIGSKPEVMTQLGGGVAARSSISAWVKGDVLDSQRASLAKEAIAAIRHDGERRALLAELIEADRAKHETIHEEPL